MTWFPVIEVRTRVMGSVETKEEVAMFGCLDPRTAVSSFPKEPSQTVKFLRWDNRDWEFDPV
jgi:hypothetical protein